MQVGPEARHHSELHIDHLFDDGYITFSSNQELLLVPEVRLKLLDAWGIDAGVRVGEFEGTEFLSRLPPDERIQTSACRHVASAQAGTARHYTAVAHAESACSDGFGRCQHHPIDRRHRGAVALAGEFWRLADVQPQPLGSTPFATDRHHRDQRCAVSAGVESAAHGAGHRSSGRRAAGGTGSCHGSTSGRRWRACRGARRSAGWWRC
jgi:hypothetical protein